MMEMTTNFALFGTLWAFICCLLALGITALLVWALREVTRRMK